MLKVLLLTFVLPLILSVSDSSAEEIRVDGGGAAVSAVFMPMKESYENTTGDTLKISYSTPAKALIALEKGAVDIIAAAVPLPVILRDIEKEGVMIDPKILEARVIERNRIVVVLHSYNDVKKLSKRQLKSIFTGKITDWKEVGGDDGKIMVVWSKETPGQNYLFSQQILDGEPVTGIALNAANIYEIREIVGRTPGAIGINPAGLVSAQVAVPETPVVESDIIVITKGSPSPKVQRVIDFYLKEVSLLH